MNHLSESGFMLDGDALRYWREPGYNQPQTNERTVELPILFRLLAQAEQAGQTVLEVGAVSPYYRQVEHEVCDPYDEKATLPVSLFDVADPYDVVVSISTLEHVGLPEYGSQSSDPGLALEAVAHLKALARHLLLFTIPLGHHAELDRAVLAGELGITLASYLMRQDWHNHWQQVPLEQATNARYGKPFNNGNCVAVCQWCQEKDH